MSVKIEAASINRILEMTMEEDPEVIVEARKLEGELSSELLLAASLLLSHNRPRKALPGVFLVVTGIDKSGKETICCNPKGVVGVRSVIRILDERGYETLGILQPDYDTETGQLIRAFLGLPSKYRLSGEISPEVSWMLWTLNRALTNAVLEYWLQGVDRAVISKRWSESNIVYHKIFGADVDRIRSFEDRFLMPDLIIILDIPPEVSLARSMERDHFEKLDFLEGVREEYLNLKRNYNDKVEIKVVDADRPLREVGHDVESIVTEFLSTRSQRP